MSNVLTAGEFEQLIEDEEIERLVDGVPAFSGSKVRLIKLDPNDFLNMINFQQSIEKHPEDHTEAGKIVHDSDAVRFAAMLLSKTIHDSDGGRPFDSGSGRLYLSRLDVESLSILSNQSIDLCGLGPGQLEAQVEAAKKNK